MKKFALVLAFLLGGCQLSLAASATTLESFSSATLAEIQGVASDGTFLYTTSVSGALPGTLKKWQKIAGVWTAVVSRALATNTDSVTHISDVFYLNDSVYVADIYNYSAAPEVLADWHPHVVMFKSSDLTCVRVLFDDTAHDSVTTEGLSYYDGEWWVIEDHSPTIYKYSAAGAFVKTYALNVGDASTVYTGYQGIDWWTEGGEKFIGTTIHDGRPALAFVVYRYNATTDNFTEVSRRTDWRFANQGLQRDPTTTNAGSVWFADRTNTAVGAVHKIDIRGWRAVDYVDRDIDYYPAGADWTTIGIPAPHYWLRMGDGTTYDYASYGSDVTVSTTNVNAPGLTEGITAEGQRACDFDGTNDALTTDSLYNVQAKLTLSVWVYPEVVATTMEIVGKAESGAGYEMYMLAADSKIYFAVHDGTAYRTAVSDSALTINTWYHITGTFDASTVKLYVGKLLQATTGTMTDSLNPSVVNFPIGANANVGPAYNLFWNGLITDVMLWKDTTFSAAQVSELDEFVTPLGIASIPYPTLQSAVYREMAGDTILVNDGRYQETVVIAKAFDYIGATSSSFGSIPEFYGAALPPEAGTVGATVSADNEIGFLTFRGYTAAQGLLGTSTSDGSLFHHLEFDSCLNAVDFDGAASGDSLINCTIDGGSLLLSTGFRATTSSAVTVIVENVIFVNTVTALTKAVAQTLTEDHNDFYNNTTDYAAALHSSDLLLNPFFFGDYRPHNKALRQGATIHSQTSPFDQIFIGVWPILPLQIGNNARWGRVGRAWGR